MPSSMVAPAGRAAVSRAFAKPRSAESRATVLPVLERCGAFPTWFVRKRGDCGADDVIRDGPERRARDASKGCATSLLRGSVDRAGDQFSLKEGGGSLVWRQKRLLRVSAVGLAVLSGAACAKCPADMQKLVAAGRDHNDSRGNELPAELT